MTGHSTLLRAIQFTLPLLIVAISGCKLSSDSVDLSPNSNDTAATEVETRLRGFSKNEEFPALNDPSFEKEFLSVAGDTVLRIEPFLENNLSHQDRFCLIYASESRGRDLTLGFTRANFKGPLGLLFKGNLKEALFRRKRSEVFESRLRFVQFDTWIFAQSLPGPPARPANPSNPCGAEDSLDAIVQKLIYAEEVTLDGFILKLPDSDVYEFHDEDGGVLTHLESAAELKHALQGADVSESGRFRFLVPTYNREAEGTKGKSPFSGASFLGRK